MNAAQQAHVTRLESDNEDLRAVNARLQMLCDNLAHEAGRLRQEVMLLEAENERSHVFLDECYIDSDGTEPLLERIGLAVREAYIDGQKAAISSVPKLGTLDSTKRIPQP